MTLQVANVTGLNLGDIRLTDLNYADDAVRTDGRPKSTSTSASMSGGRGIKARVTCVLDQDEGPGPWSLRTWGNSNHGYWGSR